MLFVKTDLIVRNAPGLTCLETTHNICFLMDIVIISIPHEYSSVCKFLTFGPCVRRLDNIAETTDNSKMTD